MTSKGKTTIKFGNGTIATPAEMQHFAALEWAKQECARLKTWFVYTVNL